MTRSLLLLALASLVCCAGCKKENMYEQQSYRSYDRDPGLPGDATEQNPVANTVAQEQPDRPVPQPAVATAQLLSRGQQRYGIFCSPCHGATGDGRGMIVERGFPQPPDFTNARLLNASAQHFYDTITNGKGSMFSYADRVPPADRWAIAAYIRALQLSRHAMVASLPPQDPAHRATAEQTP
jgi:mono/diheme cytochrome c family protein